MYIYLSVNATDVTQKETVESREKRRVVTFVLRGRDCLTNPSGIRYRYRNHRGDLCVGTIAASESRLMRSGRCGVIGVPLSGLLSAGWARLYGS